jgi:hypothetical protein
LLDNLGPAQFDAIARLMEMLARADEDEELTEAERAAVAASREYFRQNPEGGISIEEVAADCGFTMDQIRNRKSG